MRSHFINQTSEFIGNCTVTQHFKICHRKPCMQYYVSRSDAERSPLMEYEPDIHSNIPRIYYSDPHRRSLISTPCLTGNGRDKANLTIYTPVSSGPSISLMATTETLYCVRTKTRALYNSTSLDGATDN